MSSKLIINFGNDDDAGYYKRNIHRLFNERQPLDVWDITDLTNNNVIDFIWLSHVTNHAVETVRDMIKHCHNDSPALVKNAVLTVILPDLVNNGHISVDLANRISNHMFDDTTKELLNWNVIKGVVLAMYRLRKDERNPTISALYRFVTRLIGDSDMDITSTSRECTVNLAEDND